MPKLRRHNKPGDEVKVLLARTKEKAAFEAENRLKENHRNEITALNFSHSKKTHELQASLQKAQQEITRLQESLAENQQKWLAAIVPDSAKLAECLTVPDPHQDAAPHEFHKWVDDFKSYSLRTQGVRTESNLSDGTLRFHIAHGIHVSFNLKDRKVEKIDHDLKFLFARLAQILLEAVLLNKRGTIVLDPICMTNGEIGVFKKGGTAIDAARIAARLWGN